MCLKMCPEAEVYPVGEQYLNNMFEAKCWHKTCPNSNPIGKGIFCPVYQGAYWKREEF